MGSSNQHYEIIIVGGGASGMAAALAASRALRNQRQQTGKSVPSILVLEKQDRLGRKILSTGNGRCNLTNDRMEASCYYSKDRNKAFRIIKKSGLDRTRLMFHRIGIYTKSIQGYIYPYNEQASTVRDLLESAVETDPAIRVLTQAPVSRVERRKESGQDIFQVISSQGSYYGENVILTTGGYAGPAFGCSGDGYDMAARLGHKVIRPLPALTALESGAPFLKKLNGVRCQARITLLTNGKEVCHDSGQIQWTDYGVSGVVVFQISRQAILALEAGKEVRLLIDLLPDVSGKDFLLWKEDYLSDSKTGRKISIGLAMEGFLHKKLISVVLREAGLGPDTLVDNLTERDWGQIFAAAKEFPLRIRGYKGYDKAQVTQGGVDLEELTEGLESLIEPGLFYAGELVDVDGICGGYNLQWAWSSGDTAGKAAADRVNKDWRWRLEKKTADTPQLPD